MYTFLQDMIFQKSKKFNSCMYYACVFLLFFEIYRHFATAISSEKLAAMPAFYTKLNFEYWHLHSIAERVLQGKEEKETNKENI